MSTLTNLLILFLSGYFLYYSIMIIFKKTDISFRMLMTRTKDLLNMFSVGIAFITGLTIIYYGLKSPSNFLNYFITGGAVVNALIYLGKDKLKE